MNGERAYCVEYIGGPLDGEQSEPITRSEAHEMMRVSDGIKITRSGYSGRVHHDGRYSWEWKGERLIARWRQA